MAITNPKGGMKLSEDTGTATADPEQEFRDSQNAEAAKQNLPEGSVPEQRPQAAVSPPDSESDLTRRLREEGAISTEPMDKEAYDKADSDSQKKKAAKESRFPALHAGNVVKVTKGPHRDRIVAVTRVVEYADDADMAQKLVGGPEARFQQAQIIEGRARGDDRDGEVLVLDVDEDGLEKIDNYMGTGRG